MAHSKANPVIAVRVSADNPIVAPYADPASIYSGTPVMPCVRHIQTKVAIAPRFYDLRDVPIMVGFDFRKRIYGGF